MVEVGLNLMGVQELKGADPSAILDVARLAEAKGVDSVHVPDHVLMEGESHRERAGFPYPLEQPWFEPISLLSAVAAVTQRVRLGTNILVAPLRPAVLLAKQIATLDALSGGRVQMAVGVGWQRAEFAALGVDFDERYAILEEQIAACRELWGNAPASHHGARVQFDDAHAFPQPAQGGRLPILFGMALTPRNTERIVRVADGWLPAPMPTDQLAENIRTLRSALADAGRDPEAFSVVAPLSLPSIATDELRAEGRSADPFAELPGLVAAGVDSVIAHPVPYCRTVDDLDGFLDRLVGLRDGGLADEA